VLEIEDNSIDCGHVRDLVALVEGKTVKVTASSRLSLIKLSCAFQNSDLTRLLFDLPSQDSIIESRKTSVGFDLTVHAREELFLLDVDTLGLILTNEELRIESEDWLMKLILELGEGYRSLLSYVKYEFLSAEGLSTFLDNFEHSEMTKDIWCSLVRCLRNEKSPSLHIVRYGQELSSSYSFPSTTIMWELPAIFSVIEERQVRLLYRGTRDGFQTSDCESRLQGHSNLLIIVQTTEGCIFGGYAHCKYPENTNQWAMDESVKSFLFTLKNPHNIPPRIFKMNPSSKYGLYRREDRRCLVWMGYYGAISPVAGCNTNSNSCHSGLSGTGWHTFANDSDHDAKTLFTGSTNYQVKEMEIFEFFD
jgi:hypothetical protein